MERANDDVTFLQAGGVLTVEVRCNIDGGQARPSTASIHVNRTGTHGKFMALCEQWIGLEH